MKNPFDILVYIDDNLVKNLSSLVLTGYIETVTLTQAFDKTLQAGMREGDKNESSNQGSITRIEKEGFRDKNCLDSCNDSMHHYLDKDIDARQCIKEERKIQTTYTTFVLNGSLMSYLRKNQELHSKIETDIENDNIEVGDLIEIQGTITNCCILTYIDTLINFLNIFGEDYLNTLFKECNCKINYSMFLKMLTYLKSILSLNDTVDLIMETGNGKVVLTVNKNNFMNNKFSMFDNVNCHCKVVGKVIKTCTEESDTISLLRKTGQEDFFEDFFEKSKPLLECLEKNDFVLPICPKLRLDKCAIQVMPLNIYV